MRGDGEEDWAGCHRTNRRIGHKKKVIRSLAGSLTFVVALHFLLVRFLYASKENER
jgi:hypothetical protein